MKRIHYFVILIIFIIIGAGGVSWIQASTADAAGIPFEGYLASSQWVSGRVEDTGTDGKYNYIHINGIRYRLMPKVDIARRVSRGGGAYDEVTAAFRDVRVNGEVMLRVQGFRIYQILILE